MSLPLEPCIVSLDQFTLFHPSLDFLKCDVDGGETAAFHGAEQLLREKRPVLLVEMHRQDDRRVLTPSS
jgi:FkbM family methyltransferase